MSAAFFSLCGRYRYRLERECRGAGATAIIMVNPSMANAETDDQTIRKLRGFGDRNEWGRIIVGNLFAFRATDVRELAGADDPVGPDNDRYLSGIISDADRIICAWGPVSKQPQAYRRRFHRLVTLAGDCPMFSIGPVAKCGHPKHPLMLGYDNQIIPWTGTP